MRIAPGPSSLTLIDNGLVELDGGLEIEVTGVGGLRWDVDFEALIGVGSSAHVYEGRILVSDELIAVKTITTASAIEPYDREIEIMKVLKNLRYKETSHLLLFKDFAYVGDTLQIVFPKATSSLHQAVQLGVSRPDRTAAILDMAHGLAQLHEKHIVHRDIKPQNVLLLEHWRLADYGVSRNTRAHTAALTFTDAGTWEYMAPERFMGIDATESSDVYAFGCTAYAVLTGAPPFPGPERQDYARQHRTDALPSLEGVEPGLASVIRQCLSKDVIGRPAHGMALVEELGRVAGDLQSQVLMDKVGGLSATRSASEAAIAADREKTQQVLLRHRTTFDGLQTQLLKLEATLQAIGSVELVPGEAHVGGGLAWRLKIGQFYLDFEIWPPVITSESELAVYGEIRAGDSIRGNLEADLSTGRVAWNVLQFEASPRAQPFYDLGPSSRPHGLRYPDFLRHRNHLPGGSFVWRATRTGLGFEVVHDILREAMEHWSEEE